MGGMQGGRVAGLDAIRGLAILLVMIRHAWPGQFGGAGVVGVTVFFTLSGYLITGIIVRDVELRGGVDYRRFYVNRALRLLPALGLMLVFFVGVELLIGPDGGTVHLLVGTLTGLFYIQDFVPFLSYPGINHLWTLAVEEQFYLVWPLLLTFFLRRGRVNRLFAAAAGVCLASVVASMLVLTRWFNVEAVYPLPNNWAVALLVGGASYVHRDLLFERVFTPARRGPCAALALLVLTGLSVWPDAKANPATYLVWPSLIAACTVALVFLALRDKPTPRVLRPIVGLGVISYGAYLWNGPVSTWTQERLGWPQQWHWIGIVLTVTAAIISWVAVEGPALRWKARLNGRRRELAERESSPLSR
jgi:peptidoglycan/LPS O-acetylase OafA/YrhL